jgi:CSLREA domain-containing protein
MQHRRLLPPLVLLLILAACTDREPATGPVEAGGPAFSHTAGHKVVNSLADPGNGLCNATDCTLREAINDPGSTEISFAPGLTGAITLASLEAGGGPLRINKTLSITGPGTRIVIRRRSTDPAFRIFQIFNPTVAPTVTLTNLIVRGGESNIEPFGGLGGGIDNEGTLRLIHCLVVGNSGDGGGIFNSEASLTLVDSRVSNNDGGGIENSGSTAALTLTHSAVSDNSAPIQGGGISNFGGRIKLSNSTVSGNTAAVGGGGILNFGGGITLANSTISGNSAKVGGGGIFNLEGRANLTNSTVSGNSADSGGGIWNRGTAARFKLRNTTVAGNSATVDGGGIQTSGQLTLSNSLVARNTAPVGPDVRKRGGVTITARFSLLGIGNGSGVSDGVNGNQAGSQATPLDPRLGPLADNGGPTQTHALLLGSPAIDAASTPDCPPTDQRGVLRPQGVACDIGSYERK